MHHIFLLVSVLLDHTQGLKDTDHEVGIYAYNYKSYRQNNYFKVY